MLFILLQHSHTHSKGLDPQSMDVSFHLIIVIIIIITVIIRIIRIIIITVFCVLYYQ